MPRTHKEHWLGWVVGIGGDGWIDLNLIGCIGGERAVMQLHKSDIGDDKYRIALGVYVHIEAEVAYDGFMDPFRVVIGLNRILCKGNPEYFRREPHQPPLTKADFENWMRAD